MGRDTKLAIAVAAVFIGAGVWYMASGSSNSGTESAKDSTVAAKPAADKPAEASKPKSPQGQPTVAKPKPAPGVQGRPRTEGLTNARPEGAPSAARPRPLPAPAPLAAAPGERSEVVSSPSPDARPTPGPAQPGYRPQPAPTEVAVAEPSTLRPAGVGTLRPEPLTGTATQPAHEIAGPVRHPLARPTTQPSAVTAAPVAPATQAKVHTIAAGDTFSALALKYLGHVKYTNEIVKANPGLDPARLQLGAKVKIPTLPEATAPPTVATTPPAVAAGPSPAAPGAVTSPIAPRATAVRPTPRPIPADRAYTVKQGDAWYGLAQRFLGDGNEWPRLFELNKERLSGNREVLPAGVVIELPKDAKVAAVN